MGFEKVEIDLSFDKSRIGETGNLTAGCYTVAGIENPDGTARLLSIGQLVMALCLARAAELESEIVDVVDSLNANSENLERLTEIEREIVEAVEGNVDLAASKFSDGISYKAFLDGMGIAVVGNTASAHSEQLVSDIEAKMDSLNSFSQQTMIDLQSLTAKRDQSYDMISNILKSLYTTLSANVGNM